ncbi:MAG: hypothetical protein MMC23_006630 [Stictis urceolatum]|nr:hypothetical protein [Stictis urceolata]
MANGMSIPVTDSFVRLLEEQHKYSSFTKELSFFYSSSPDSHGAMDPQLQALFPNARWEFVRQIQAGTSDGELWLFRCRQSDKLCLAKVITSSFDDNLDEDDTEGVRHGMFGNHPNIVKLHQYKLLFPTPDKETLIMEFCEGGTVDDLCDFAEAWRRLVPPPFIWYILLTVFDVVMHFKTSGLCHNDIHCGNVAFVPKEEDPRRYPVMKLIDFGMSVNYANVELSDDEEEYTLCKDASVPYDVQTFANSLVIRLDMKRLPYTLRMWIYTLRQGEISCSEAIRHFRPLAEEMGPKPADIMAPWLVEYFRLEVVNAAHP